MKTIDEFCKRQPGSFQRFIANLAMLEKSEEKARKKRIAKLSKRR